MLSLVSGFGNSLIIFTINTAITLDNNIKIRLLVYFFLGVILYVYGQRIMRCRLIVMTNDIVYTKRIEIVEALLKIPFNSFEIIDKDRIQATLNNDTERISRFVNILISGVTSAITLIFCFVYLGFVNIYALLLSMVTLILIASIYYIVGRYANKIGEQSRDLQNIFFKFINDLIGGIKELSLNHKRKKEFKSDMELSCKNYKDKRNDAEIAFANMFVIGELMFTLAIGVVVFIFPLLLKNLGNIDISSFVFILLYMTGPIHGILNTIPNIIEVRISFRRINQMLSQIPSVETQTENEVLLKEKLNLKLKEVEYEYENTEGRNFRIGPIDYEFNSGEIVFITGGNGSGKSTFAKLLSGLYKSSNGNIWLNNKKVNVTKLNQQFTTIFSDFHLFEKLYGIDYIGKEEEIKKYLEILQLHEKVEIKDGKFSTLKLSTGQKKRLALVVSYLEDKPIYLFDEWAADQDPEFRSFFYKALLPDLKNRGKCVIVITHDDHYFNLADRVIKMDMGKLVSE